MSNTSEPTPPESSPDGKNGKHAGSSGNGRPKNGNEIPNRIELLHEPDSLMLKPIDDAKHVARFNKTPVLIVGETGVGKEGIAHLLHTESRLQGKWVAVNCARLSMGLAGSELFGHEKGSYTGAHQQHIGVFERADGGTLFLDEITEMPAELQAQLLRVLETGLVLKVGGSEEKKVNVRVIAATNRDPEQAIAEGKLRKDLYYRLRKIKIRVPPLREHRMDIPLLAQHFAEKAVKDYIDIGAKVPQFTPEAMEKLKTYPYPGNIRDLEGAVTSAALYAQRSSPEIITPEMLEFPEVKADLTHVSKVLSRSSKTDGEQSIDVLLKQMKDLVEEYGSINKVSAEMRIGRATLWSYLKSETKLLDSRPQAVMRNYFIKKDREDDFDNIINELKRAVELENAKGKS